LAQLLAKRLCIMALQRGLPAQVHAHKDDGEGFQEYLGDECIA